MIKTFTILSALFFASMGGGIITAAVDAQESRAPAVPAAPAVNPKLDQRLITMLNATQLKYRIVPGGECHIRIILPNGRHQIVIAQSHTEHFGELERRRFYSPVGVDLASLSTGAFIKLLTDTDRMKVGGWAVITTTSNKPVLVWMAKVPAELKQNELRALVNEGAKYVDTVEANLAHNDKF